jgi:hypothetical protein
VAALGGFGGAERHFVVWADHGLYVRNDTAGLAAWQPNTLSVRAKTDPRSLVHRLFMLVATPSSF